ncbi:MAG: hypothetical protein E4H03_09425 [Myxococcales bacterium]|nr:MAG: hypothetical protein E4H03_09425 [Myxococcales bacterium]
MLSGAKATISRPGAFDRWALLLTAALVGVMTAEALMYVYGIEEHIFLLRALGLVSEPSYVNAGAF